MVYGEYKHTGALRNTQHRTELGGDSSLLQFQRMADTIGSPSWHCCAVQDDGEAQMIDREGGGSGSRGSESRAFNR